MGISTTISPVVPVRVTDGFVAATVVPSPSYLSEILRRTAGSLGANVGSLYRIVRVIDVSVSCISDGYRAMLRYGAVTVLGSHVVSEVHTGGHCAKQLHEPSVTASVLTKPTTRIWPYESLG